MLLSEPKYPMAHGSGGGRTGRLFFVAPEPVLKVAPITCRPRNSDGAAKKPPDGNLTELVRIKFASFGGKKVGVFGQALVTLRFLAINCIISDALWLEIPDQSSKRMQIFSESGRPLAVRGNGFPFSGLEPALRSPCASLREVLHGAGCGSSSEWRKWIEAPSVACRQSSSGIYILL